MNNIVALAQVYATCLLAARTGHFSRYELYSEAYFNFQRCIEEAMKAENALRAKEPDGVVISSAPRGGE